MWNKLGRRWTMGKWDRNDLIFYFFLKYREIAFFLCRELAQFNFSIKIKLQVVTGPVGDPAGTRHSSSVHTTFSR